MSYEDLQEARAKRAVKDAAKGKDKRAEKSKIVTSEAGEAVVQSEQRGRKRKQTAPPTGKPKLKTKAVRVATTPDPMDVIMMRTDNLQITPVARMI